MGFTVLAIETSCDDTSVALVDDSGWVIAQRSAHQDLVHQPFGGVVPELAGRKHYEDLLPLIDKLLSTSHRNWSDIHGIAVTSRPGLLGSLIVGLVTAKTLSIIKNKPFIGIHHIEGHILSAFLSDQQDQANSFWTESFLALVISGGHSHLYHVPKIGEYHQIGKTQDDAAGEAFDKFAKMLQLGYPGGVHIDRLAQNGRTDTFEFPRALIKEDHFDFSFSGLKSAGQRTLESLANVQDHLPDLCASYQEAIVDVLLYKLEKAIIKYNLKKVVITGGVSANSRLRSRADLLSKKYKMELRLPPLKYCTDNAAMIGFAGALRLAKGEFSGQDLAPKAREQLK